MKKITLLFLILTVSALVNSKIVRRKKLNAKRQIFDTLDYNKGYSERLSPNQIILKGYDKPATYLPPTKFVPSTYLPPTSPTTTRTTTLRTTTPTTTRRTTTPTTTRRTTTPTTTRRTTTPTTTRRTTTPKFVPSTYLPPSTTTKKLSTPGSKYIIPTIGSTIRTTVTLPPLRPIPTYTGTFPTYKFSTYNYTFTGTYPTTPYTFKPLVTVSTTPRPIGYVYTAPASNPFGEKK